MALKGKKQSFVRANVMPGFIGSVLDCPKGFSNFTTKAIIIFTALTVTLTYIQELQIQQLKSTIESLHKEVSELKSRHRILLIFLIQFKSHRMGSHRLLQMCPLNLSLPDLYKHQQPLVSRKQKARYTMMIVSLT